MEEILTKIDSPSNLKLLDRRELEALAEEIRWLIIQTVAQTGGHLAANLGVVELTIALHKVFNSPQDKIIWDVGHQCYPHKILTGRKNQFHTLRQYGGLNGFPKRNESSHDVFDTGHSSTSISAAVGMCIANGLNRERTKIIAVIGDGALTGGMALEALNNAGALKKDLLVILNDNEMSISPNVGAFSVYLNRLITGQLYNKVKQEIEGVIRSIPQIGWHMAKMAGRLDEAFKSLVVPGIMFEELGFKYIGPIPGHNLPVLIDTLEAIKRFQKPILLHVLTKKGKGYAPAEKNPAVYHSAAPFMIASGYFKQDGENDIPSYTEVFSKTMIRLAHENPNIVAITAAMPDGTGLGKFAKLFPERFFDVGIAEQHAVTMAAGMACQGLRPVVAIYSTFLQRAYDQILHDVCLQNLPVILAIDRAGLVGEDGPTHHGAFDLSYLRHLPNLTIMAPCDENELRHMLYTASMHQGPVAIRYPRGSGRGVNCQDNLAVLPFGQGEILRPGTDLTILAIGSMVYEAMAAAEQLENEGILAQVINARFVKPLDQELIVQACRSTGRVITVEENALCGGFGSAVLELLADYDLIGSVRLHRLGLPDRFIPAGSREILKKEIGLTVANIVETARRLCSNLSIDAHTSTVASSGTSSGASSGAFAGPSSGALAGTSSGALAGTSSGALAGTSSGALAGTSSGASAGTSSGASAGALAGAFAGTSSSEEPFTSHPSPSLILG